MPPPEAGRTQSGSNRLLGSSELCVATASWNVGANIETDVRRFTAI